jgi:transposase
MVRRHQVDGVPISEVAVAFGVSRPTFYKAQTTLAETGLGGLLPRPRGPKAGHKLSAAVLTFVDALKSATPELTIPQCLDAIAARFDIKIHRRSLERALTRKKKALDPM